MTWIPFSFGVRWPWKLAITAAIAILSMGGVTFASKNVINFWFSCFWSSCLYFSLFYSWICFFLIFSCFNILGIRRICALRSRCLSGPFICSFSRLSISSIIRFLCYWLSDIWQLWYHIIRFLSCCSFFRRLIVFFRTPIWINNQTLTARDIFKLICIAFSFRWCTNYYHFLAWNIGIVINMNKNTIFLVNIWRCTKICSVSWT